MGPAKMATGSFEPVSPGDSSCAANLPAAVAVAAVRRSCHCPEWVARSALASQNYEPYRTYPAHCAVWSVDAAQATAQTSGSVALDWVTDR